MEEEKTFGEQQEAEISTTETVERSPENAADEDVEPSKEVEKSVSLGKFKNVEDLYKAYNNLQAEFTRKSQKLAELEKDKAQDKTSDKEESLKAFLSKNRQALAYVDELNRRVAEQEISEQAYEKAWGEIIYEKFTKKNLSEEPLVQNFVLNDNGLQEMILKNYIEQLQQQKTPFIMKSTDGETLTKPTLKRVNTFEEAKEVAIELISKN